DQHTRRGFLAIAGAGAAGAAGAGILSAGTAHPTTSGTTTTTVPPGVDAPLVAYVRDAHAGTVAIMIGEREVTVQDPDLAARIARAAVGR
ncbi:MAG: hypothetical protein ACRDVG_01555, partial [Jatrophihabitantaceae bacterium]